MDGYILGLLSALWLGILTSISPCPLATNIAAISYIGSGLKSPVRVFSTGAMYTAGRAAAYIVIAMLLIGSVLSIVEVSFFLQKYLNKILGPILILVGMILLGLIAVKVPSSGWMNNLSRRLSGHGMWGAALIGILFALSLCPVSAALFFGSLLPLAVKFNSTLIYPLAFGIGTALPVLVFAAALVWGAHAVGKVFRIIQLLEKNARKITGVVFIVAGIYYTLTFIFRII